MLKTCLGQNSEGVMLAKGVLNQPGVNHVQKTRSWSQDKAVNSFPCKGEKGVASFPLKVGDRLTKE
jgi:hypothetical protein